MSRLVVTAKGRRWLAGGHPWVYADDVALAEAEPGDLVRVEDRAGAVLGHALHSRGSKIAARLVTRVAEPPDPAFWERRVAAALALREEAGLLAPGGAARLVHGDAEGFPGWVVDRYGDVVVVQSGTQGADRMSALWLELLEAALPWPVRAVVERSDAGVRRLEGLEKRAGVLRGTLPEPLRVESGGLVHEVDVLGGHKTGHYLDQRENRARAAERVRARARRGERVRVLDAFCYDGLFGLAAARAGAEEVVCLDQSAPALERARRNAEASGVAGRVATERDDALDALRRRAAAGEAFDLVVVDPPAFAKNRAQVAGAVRGYVELNRRALALVRPGGWLVTCSCSYNLRAPEFLDCLARAAAAAGREAWLEELHGAGVDHPVSLSLPESGYLKVAFLRVGPPAILPGSGAGGTS